MTSDSYISKLYREVEARTGYRSQGASKKSSLSGVMLYKFVADFVLCVATASATFLLLSHRSNSSRYPLSNSLLFIGLGGLLFSFLLRRRSTYSSYSHLFLVYETAGAIRTSIQFALLLLAASFFLKIPVPHLAIILVFGLMPLLLTLQNRLVHRVFSGMFYGPSAADENIEAGIAGMKRGVKQGQKSSLRPDVIAEEVGRRVSRRYTLSKRLLDILFSSIFLVFLSPVFILLALIIRLSSNGPALFVQRRVGRGGKLFWMYKFRSMSTDVRRYETSPQMRNDPRITKIGRILRRTSLDELPQLINVFLGEMSLVGPRPEMPFIVRGYTARQRERLQVMPGVTGLWQLSRDRAFPIHENIHHDLYYIRNRNLYMDLAILIHTLFFAMHGGI